MFSRGPHEREVGGSESGKPTEEAVSPAVTVMKGKEPQARDAAPPKLAEASRGRRRFSQEPRDCQALPLLGVARKARVGPPNPGLRMRNVLF